ncbi:MAG: GNAT family N-acetyltransferase [Bacteroidetes bacterium]|nr:GNAT family N-acetyltransferase [Bacteroidota bacterium]
MTNNSDNIRIQLYEPHMKQQVAKLFELEYKISDVEFGKFMSRLYDHPYQKEKCIQIVALDGEKVVGFQSFFYWPYCYNNSTYKSYQSGNSLVHPEYRGKRLFARMLNFIHENPIGKEVDFLMGFPVQASFNSFIKNGWDNLFNLQWYVKLINPFGILFSKKKLSKYFSETKYQYGFDALNAIHLSEESEFRQWKKQLVYEPDSYYQYTYSKGEKTVVFDLKIQVRKKLINELVIGSIRFDEKSKEEVNNAITELIKTIWKTACVSMISIAINETFQTPEIQKYFRDAGFKKIENKIFFIIKPLKKELPVTNASVWNIGRADIDTW